MPLLEVGNIVYGENNYNGLYRYKIDRVTNTLAISGNTRFNREYDNHGWVKLKGEREWDRILYQIETEELKLEYERQQIILLIRNHKFQLNTTEQLREIKRIIKETPEEKIK